MKNKFFFFISQLMIIGLAINVRTDIPFWKQFVAFCVIACILPAADAMNNYNTPKIKDENTL